MRELNATEISAVTGGTSFIVLPLVVILIPLPAGTNETPKAP